MVSNAKEDLPEPDSPVKTIILLRGSFSEMFLRLCSRAPLISMNSCIPFTCSRRRPIVPRREAAVNPSGGRDEDDSHERDRRVTDAVAYGEREGVVLDGSAARQQPDAAEPIQGRER